MARVFNGAPTGGFVSLKGTRYVLAPASEFIYDGEAPVAHQVRFGSMWVGWQTFGEIIKVSMQREGTEANLSNAQGGSRGKVWNMPGWSAELTVQHDRALPELDLGDIVSVWVRTNTVAGADEIPEKKRFYVKKKGYEEGDGDTAQYKVTLGYEEGWMDETSLTLVRAKVDALGNVIEFTEGVRYDASSTAPGSALPTEV